MSPLQSNRHHVLLILLGNVLQVLAGYYGSVKKEVKPVHTNQNKPILNAHKGIVMTQPC